MKGTEQKKANPRFFVVGTHTGSMKPEIFLFMQDRLYAGVDADAAPAVDVDGFERLLALRDAQKLHFGHPSSKSSSGMLEKAKACLYAWYRQDLLQGQPPFSVDAASVSHILTSSREQVMGPLKGVEQAGTEGARPCTPFDLFSRLVQETHESMWIETSKYKVIALENIKEYLPIFMWYANELYFHAATGLKRTCNDICTDSLPFKLSRFDTGKYQRDVFCEASQITISDLSFYIPYFDDDPQYFEENDPLLQSLGGSFTPSWNETFMYLRLAYLRLVQWTDYKCLNVLVARNNVSYFQGILNKTVNYPAVESAVNELMRIGVPHGIPVESIYISPLLAIASDFTLVAEREGYRIKTIDLSMLLGSVHVDLMYREFLRISLYAACMSGRDISIVARNLGVDALSSEQFYRLMTLFTDKENAMDKAQVEQAVAIYSANPGSHELSMRSLEKAVSRIRPGLSRHECIELAKIKHRSSVEQFKFYKKRMAQENATRSRMAAQRLMELMQIGVSSSNSTHPHEPERSQDARDGIGSSRGSAPRI